MKTEANLPFQASISFEKETLSVVGSKNLLLKVKAMQNEFGLNPQGWPLLQPAQSSDDLLINQFIKKMNSMSPVYNHDELCHCRMVKTETVMNAIVAGARSAADVARTTLAGTGCGSCRGDTENLLNEILNPK